MTYALVFLAGYIVGAVLALLAIHATGGKDRKP